MCVCVCVCVCVRVCDAITYLVLEAACLEPLAICASIGIQDARTTHSLLDCTSRMQKWRLQAVVAGQGFAFASALHFMYGRPIHFQAVPY